MKKVGLFFIFSLLVMASFAQTTPLWMRYPSISPDGKTIVFGYQGNLFKVASTGGIATPITAGSAHNMMPVWSKDGKSIAFASDRYGNFDVFVMAAIGGQPTRVTENSANDYPYDFSIDNRKVIFGSSRQAPASSVRFPSLRLFQNLYAVDIKGGRPVLISAAGVENAKYNSDGTAIVFQDRKGYEDPWRKHQTSSVTRDIWIYDVAKNTYSALTHGGVEYREPVFSKDGQYVYCLAESDGTLNLYKKGIRLRIADQQITKFKDHPVRHLSIANDNTLCFTWNGEIYTVKDEEQPKKLQVQVALDNGNKLVENSAVNGNVTQFKLSADGKEVAYITRGEVYVTSVEGNYTKRITNTSEQERMVQWSPDGKTLIYAAERGRNGWGVYKTTIVNNGEPYFSSATVLKEEPLIVGQSDNFKPVFSPDGKSIAYIEDRNMLKVYSIATKKTITLIPKGRNYSYADGDWGFEWSPDSKWIVADDQQGYFSRENMVLLKADGTGTPIYPVNSGFGESRPGWALDGKMLTWASSKFGRSSLAYQGSRELDIYGIFFDQETYDRFNLSKDDFNLLKEKETKTKPVPITTKPTKDKTPVTDSNAPKKPLVLDFTNSAERIVRLTTNSASIGDYALNKDGSSLYYLADFEKGYDIWVTDTRTKETKILLKLGGTSSGIELSKDGKSLFLVNKGNLLKVDIAAARATPISNSSDLTIDAAAERNYIFNHAWLQVKRKFYQPDLHGVKWDDYYTAYAKFLPHVSNNYDFQELLSEILGELNASHTGGRYSPKFPNADQTASLGLLYDETYTGQGLKVKEVIAGGPFDKAGANIKPDAIITTIDGEKIDDSFDWARLLNRKVDKFVAVAWKNKAGDTQQGTIKPIVLGEEIALMYKRWIKSRRELVEKLSNGKLGYIHVKGMDDDSYRDVYDDVMGKNRDKQALIVDTRFNGGGWLHDDLNTLLSGKLYLRFSPQGNIVKGGEPVARWQKPSIVVMSEGNYSDAFIFPYIYKQNGIGKLVGMPVPGTGTAVWWETQIDPTIVFGIPMIGTIGKENRTTENLQVEPDIRVPLTYEEFLNGKDAQLEAAVAEMMKEVK